MKSMKSVLLQVAVMLLMLALAGCGFELGRVLTVGSQPNPTPTPAPMPGPLPEMPTPTPHFVI